MQNPQVMDRFPSPGQSNSNLGMLRSDDLKIGRLSRGNCDLSHLKGMFSSARIRGSYRFKAREGSDATRRFDAPLLA